jgi:hypothetical protein
MMNGESGHSFARQAAGYQYARTPGATAAIVDNVKSALGELTSWYDQIDPGAADAYRATTWYFSWGSNHTMANWALSWLYADQLGAGAKGTERRSAEEYLHWFHGRNPLSWVYLSNMGEKGVDAGAEKSVIELYHGWFWDGSEDFDGADSRYGMAPGFVAGGPNQAYCDYSDQTACLRELMDQPPAKSYHDWNGGWNEAKHANENSWEVTEPGIYYQAAYVHLLSYFVPTATAAIRSGRFRATAPAASMRVRGGTTLYRLDGRKLDLRSGSRRLSRGVYYERAADGTVRRFVTIR